MRMATPTHRAPARLSNVNCAHHGISARLATMSDVTNWKVPKWPFFLADALLLGSAYFFMLRAPQSIHHWEIAVALRCTRCRVECDSLLSRLPGDGKSP